MPDTIVGFLGLGQMGRGIAANLIRAGVKLRVYNRTPERAKELDAERVDDPRQVAEPGGVVLSMLTDDAAVREVTAELPERLGPGGVHVCLATVSIDLVQAEVERYRAVGATYLAAPVFGRPPAAEAGKLFVCVSGESAARERVRPLLEAIGQGVYDFGDHTPAANVVKLSGNFLIGAAIEAMAEAYTFAEKNGVDRQAVHDMLASTFFACPGYRNYGPMVAAKSYPKDGVPTAILRKDLGLLLDQARQSHVPMPFANIVYDALTTVVARGHGDEDFTGLARVASDNAGL